MRRRLSLLFAALLSLSLITCMSSAPPAEIHVRTAADRAELSRPVPPVAKVIPKQLEEHGDVRTDNYYWLKERENPEVIHYLEQENAYTDSVMKHTESLQKTIFDEIVSRIPQTDESVPFREDGFLYYARFETGKEYPVYCRKAGEADAPEQIILDVNELAKGHEFFSTRGLEISSGKNILAFATDDVGRRIYTLRFRDLDGGEMLPDQIPNVTGNLAWANDNRTIFYTRQDLETLRWYQVWCHRLGDDPADDALVYEEADPTFDVYVTKLRSKKYIAIASTQTLASEYRILEADRPSGKFRVFEPRERGHEYSIDHLGDTFYIRTNLDGAKNFKVMKTPDTATTRDHWTELVASRDDVLIRGFELFRDFLVLSEQRDGLNQIHILPWSGKGEHTIDFGEPAYQASLGDNKDVDTSILRYEYESMTTPPSVYDYDMKSHDRTLLKRQQIDGGFDSAAYTTERIFATARDGVRVPISLVYRKGLEHDGTHPLLLYGYGSYGYGMSAGFDPARFSLLDRGFVYAIAHIRGGDEMGRAWYEDGKLLHKKNTFTDFIDCAEALIRQGYADPDEVFAYGGSAGGLLMGAVTNMRPDLWKGVVAAVPFVDVVTTMLDPDIPLTTAEYDEWGNPNDPRFYDYMKSYSPYDNVEAKRYPNLLVTTGLHDSQVQYWEPAKWVAKMRAMKTDSNLLMLKTNMDAGHGGASGRFRRQQLTAFIYAFMLDLVDSK